MLVGVFLGFDVDSRFDIVTENLSFPFYEFLLFELTTL